MGAKAVGSDKELVLAPQPGKQILAQNGFVVFTLFCSSVSFLSKKEAWALERHQINKSSPGATGLGIFVLH